jgi:hypothetical protein
MIERFRADGLAATFATDFCTKKALPDQGPNFLSKVLTFAQTTSAASLGQQCVSAIKIFLRDFVLVRCGFLRQFLQRLAIGLDRLLQRRRAAPCQLARICF